MPAAGPPTGNHVYSLVSASVLGFDLTRLHGGPATAELLLRALCLNRADLPVLAACLPGEDLRAPLWLQVEQAIAGLPSLSTLADQADQAAALVRLERAPIGTADGLLRLVRHDVLRWTWTGTGRSAVQDVVAERATAVLCDAVVASYLADALPVAVRRRLGAGWVAAVRRLPVGPPVDLGPHHYEVSALLQKVSALRPADAARLERAALHSRRRPENWATAVHSASWAAFLSDRVNTAAAAQLLLVQALDLSTVPVPVRASGAWNLLSGAVQALVVRDLLDSPTAHKLLSPAVAALGPVWLSGAGDLAGGDLAGTDAGEPAG